ncbi:GNAT family N-acetyltransferase [Candidatus Enterococcus huntleyi]|uniref:GNAT family N-acetyltransferase n=1 Tax=Candidatus Enterococcus huntleyi TaxID=1857217 RepID=UPI00137A02DE|nr:GNAT family N-acetyltransferase [Enterococcus sp. JM4C]
MEIKKVDYTENSERISQLLTDQQIELFGEGSENKEFFSIAAYQEEDYLGGLTAVLTGNRLHISLLAIKPTYRGQNYGTLLVEEAEKIATAKHCKHLTVNTQEYQGLTFYQKLGFSVYGQIEDCPFEGTTKYFLRKLIAQSLS